MNAVMILYAIAAIFIILVAVNYNKPEKDLARKTWLRIALIFIVVATVNWLLIS